MASNHPIDRLFREKTGNASMQPSADAWNQIQSQITKKPTAATWSLRIAASIALLCVGAFLVWNYTKQIEGPTFADADGIEVTAPSDIRSVAIKIPERMVLPEKKAAETVLVAQEESTPNVDFKKEVIEQPTVPLMEWEDITKIQSIQVAKTEFVLPPVNFESSDDNNIQIKYFTNATSTPTDASKVKLAKIIDYARTSNPIDWVGDLRAKKDELVDNVFSLD